MGALVVAIASAGAAQERVLKPRPPVVRLGEIDVLDNPAAQKADIGPPVRMPVSLNIDRHLRKAQGFLDRGNYPSAFTLLLDVIEGRTLTDDEAPPETPPAGGDAWESTSARNAVFSEDDRLYRPVKRLCHEVLAALPADGIAAFRAEYEFEAERELQTASAACDAPALESIVDRYFATLSAGHALELAGDLKLDRGQFRAALQDYRALLDVYPESARRDARIDDTYVRAKIALCFSLLGADDEARATIEELGRAAPGATLRIEGQLFAGGELTAHPAFAGAAAHAPPAGLTRGSRGFTAKSELVPLWMYRFADAHPYRVVRDERRAGARVIRGFEGSTSPVSISPTLHVPGTSAVLAGDDVVFLDHFRVRVHEAISGRMLLATSEAVEEKLQPDAMRARVPVYDFATTRIAAEGNRLFAVIGSSNSRGEALLDNRIVAYEASSLAQVWSTEDVPELASLTFLASPIVSNDKLLVPVLDSETVALQAIDPTSGASIYRVGIHRGGSLLTRPPAVRVAMHQGTAYVLSNAGALAAVDAHTGSLLWIRRYERLHPLRPEQVKSSQQNLVAPFQVYSEIPKLPGFAPSDIVAADGLVVIAPSDGTVLLCLDGSSGEPVWMLNREQRVPNAIHKTRASYVIGHDGKFLFVGGDQDVTCIDLHTGVRLWREELPTALGQPGWRGRGTVAGNTLVMPGVRELLVREIGAAAQGSEWRRIPLPELSIGNEPLDGPFNIEIAGAYLIAAYEGGIEVYSTVEALQLMADDASLPEQRAMLLAQAGDLVAACDTLATIDVTAIDDPRRRCDVAHRLLTIASELSAAMAAHGARRDALDVLDRCRTRLTDPHDVMLWHLARIEVFQALTDLDGVESEQRALHALMEGK